MIGWAETTVRERGDESGKGNGEARLKIGRGFSSIREVAGLRKGRRIYSERGRCAALSGEFCGSVRMNSSSAGRCCGDALRFMHASRAWKP